MGARLTSIPMASHQTAIASMISADSGMLAPGKVRTSNSNPSGYPASASSSRARSKVLGGYWCGPEVWVFNGEPVVVGSGRLTEHELVNDELLVHGQAQRLPHLGIAQGIGDSVVRLPLFVIVDLPDIARVFGGDVEPIAPQVKPRYLVSISTTSTPPDFKRAIRDWASGISRNSRV